MNRTDLDPEAFIMNDSTDGQAIADEMNIDTISKVLACGLLVTGYWPNFDIYYANEIMISMLGYSSLEEMKHSLQNRAVNFICSDDLYLITPENIKQNTSENGFSIECRMIKKDQSFMWVKQHSKNVILKNGQKVILSSFFDISSVKEQIEKEENVLNSIPGGVALYQISQDSLSPLYFTDGISNLIEYTREEFMSIVMDDPFTLVYEKDRKKIRENLFSSFGEKRDYTELFRIKTKNRHMVWVRANVHFMKDSNEKSLVHIVFHNISRENSVYESIIESSDVGILIIDVHSMELIYANEQVYKYTQTKQADYIGAKCYKFMFDENSKCEGCSMEQAMKCGNAHHLIKIKKLGKNYSCKLKSMDWYGRDVVTVFITDITQSVQEQHELLHSERLLRQAVEDSNLLSWEYSFEKETLINENQILRDAGYVKNPDNLVESQINDGYLAPESHDLYREMFRKMREGSPTVCGELWLYKNRDTNDKHCIRVSYTVDFDNEGNPVSASGLGLDITNEKNMEILYQKQVENLMRSYPDAIGIIKMNLTSDLVTSQIGFHKLTPVLKRNLHISDYLKALQESLPPEDEGRYEEHISRERLLKAYENGESQFSYVYHFQMEQTAKWINTTVKIMRNPMTRNIEAYIFVIDISEKIVSEQIVKKIIGTGYDVLALIYTENKYVDYYHYGDEYKDIIKGSDKNYDENRMKTAVFYGKEHKDEYLKLTELDNVIKELNEAGKFVFTLPCSLSGKKMYKSYSYFYLAKEHDVILATVQDVTALYEKEEEHIKEVQAALNEAEKANAAKTAFLSNISHDIRTPMNAIINMAKMAQEDIESPEKALDELNKINVSSAFLLSLINDVLDMAKIDSGKLELHLDVYEYSEFLNYVDSVFTPLCKNKDIQFIWSPGPTELAVYVDILRFNQVFFNLLSNAVKYTPAGGTIWFTVKNNEIKENYLSCDYMIKDTGQGMSMEFQQKMFEPFTQEVSTPGHAGTGLGLAIVKSTIDMMGGTIRVESAPGKGTTFMIHLSIPIATKEQIAERNRRKKTYETVDLTGKHVLIAEDNQMNREIIKHLLERKGCILEMTENGQECLNQYLNHANNYFDAILMDVRMPVMDGLEATRQIRASQKEDCKKIPIIAMTANAFAEDKIIGEHAGMSAYLVKPIDSSELFQTLFYEIKNRA